MTRRFYTRLLISITLALYGQGIIVRIMVIYIFYFVAYAQSILIDMAIDFAKYTRRDTPNWMVNNADSESKNTIGAG